MNVSRSGGNEHWFGRKIGAREEEDLEVKLLDYESPRFVAVLFQAKLLHYGIFVAVLFQEVEELNVGLQGKVELAKRRIYMAEIHRCFVSKKRKACEWSI